MGTAQVITILYDVFSMEYTIWLPMLKVASLRENVLTKEPRKVESMLW